MDTSSSPSGPVDQCQRSERGVWVVGIDGSASSRHAALWASEHVSGRGNALHLLTAWHPPFLAPISGWGGHPGSPQEAFESSSHEHVERLATEMRKSIDAPVETIVCRGGAASCLLDAGGHASLLVVGSRGRGGFARLTLGSTSTQCATHADIPTAIIPIGAPIGRARRIVVAVDGSPNSVAAARWAIDFADAGSTVECVMVWDVTPLITSDTSFVLPETTELVRKRFAETMNELTRTTDRRDIEIVQRFEEGMPRGVLRRAAEQADLFVMGARGQGLIGSALLGSVSSWLLHHVDRTLVVVPDTASDIP
jgi:nucleotide-binding universal stress UspA family protein